MKRARTLSTQETTDTLGLTQASVTTVTGFETKDVNGNDTKHFTSRTRHSGVSELSHRELLDILCPSYRVLRDWYGNSFSGYARVGGATANADRKSIAWTSPAQAWETFIHLPLTITTGSTYSLKQLVAKAIDVNNFSVITAQPANPFDPAGQEGYECQFCYYGGFVEHVFTNTCNMNIELEFFISTPRRMISFANATYGTLPAQLSLEDKFMNTPLRNTVAPVWDGTAYDSSTDQAFTFNKTDRSLTYNWKTSAPKRATLLPGQQLRFMVKLPSFKFTNSDFSVLLGKVGNTSVLPEFAPFCSVILDVRARAEIAHNAAYTSVNYGSGHYTHVQKEYHRLRAMPYASTSNSVILNNLDAGPADLVINPLTEAEMTYDN